MITWLIVRIYDKHCARKEAKLQQANGNRKTAVDKARYELASVCVGPSTGTGLPTDTSPNTMKKAFSPRFWFRERQYDQISASREGESSCGSVKGDKTLMGIKP